MTIIFKYFQTAQFIFVQIFSHDLEIFITPMHVVFILLDV